MISRSRLIDIFNQLHLNASDGDILIRVHTAAHKPEEAVELAKLLKKLVPRAHIFGTSTSAIIINGKLVRDKCVISVSKMNSGTIHTDRIPVFNEDGEPIPIEELCQNVKDRMVREDTKVLLTFLTVDYHNVFDFVDMTNEFFPGIQMIGGYADCPESNLNELPFDAFLFDEKGWTNSGMILASIGGKEVEAMSAFATGVEALGKEAEITDSFSTSILEINGEDAAERYTTGIGDILRKKREITSLFPYVYVDQPDFPIFVHYVENKTIGEMYPESDPNYREFYEKNPKVDRTTRKNFIRTNHNVQKGDRIRRAFLFDKKIIADNRTMFQRVENFEKAETIFAYSCIVRSIIYSNCINWELSAYENSNIAGCITYGEIVNVKGINKFVSGSFVMTVLGEESVSQMYNPYAFQYTESLVEDNEELIDYLVDIEKKMLIKDQTVTAEALKGFVTEMEQKLLYSSVSHLPNLAALNLDIQTKGYDRLCVIDVFDASSMNSVFSERQISMTRSNYLTKCDSYARAHDYKMYELSDWKIVIASPSYIVSLSKFTSDMEKLQKKLFENLEEFIPIVPVFAVINNCKVENYNNAYNSAVMKMRQKNMQFSVNDALDNELDEEAIIERYRMVNVINYAIANDKVIPYFQGIHDNKEDKISHYEALMRLEGEDGKIYFPGSFLDVARSYGILYDTISFMMIKKVFQMFKDSEEKCVSINLGIRDIRNKEIVDYIYDFLSTASNPDKFIFELLENEDIDDYDEMTRFVSKIHELGGRIAIDDFGSGFSNLQHVISLQIDVLKIDGSLIRNCLENPEAENLLALISTWKGFTNHKIDITAEFVENEEIQQKLLQYNIDYSQGYLFSKPSPDIEL